MARQNAVLPVLIVLTNQPHREILERIEGASQLRIAAAEGEYRRLLAQSLVPNDALRQAQNALDAVLLEVRRAEFAEIEAAIGPDQGTVEADLAALGAANIQRYSVINMIGADIPAAALDALAVEPLIAVVFPAETHQALIDISVPALGAPAFWSLGYTGAGQSAAILDTGVHTAHPAFAGVNFNSQVFLTYGSTSSCYADFQPPSPDDMVGHGTHIAGITTSRGQTGGHENYLGVAEGLGTLYDLKIGYQASSAPPCGGSGVSDSRDVMAALNWAITNAPSLKVFNYSFGGTATSDDDGFSQQIDNLVDLYGLTIAVAAGNGGSSAYTVASPGIAYNIISVASIDDNATPTRSDDFVAGYSSRGPTIGGRDKPDIAAPGSADGIGIISTGLNSDWVSKQGTSMATPHIAASVALLRSAGVPSALVAKAILLNTTDNTGWQSDRGWGYANLTTASQQLNYLTGSIAPASQTGHFAFYKGTVAANFRATLTWNRHISGAISSFNNLDLYLYDAGTGTVIDSSASTLQNVEQLTAAAAANAVLKVVTPSSSFSGVSTEAFAVALSTGGFTSANGPSLSINCSAPATVGAPTPFLLTCTATNNGDLPAIGATGTVALPAGFTGSTALSFGTVQPGTSSPASTTLTPPNAGGNYTLSVAARSVSFGETLTANWNSTIGVYGAVAVTVATSPSGLAIVVDGTSLTSPQVLNWIGGSSHTISVASPQSIAGARYVFGAWSDGGAATHTIVLPIVPPSYTASFTASQYLLTSNVSPVGSGTVAPNPSSPDGYYSIGASVQLTAASANGFQFSGWSGDLSGAANPQSVVMSAPRSVTANFGGQTAIIVTTNPLGLAITVDGASMTAPQTFNWLSGSNHAVNVVSPQGSSGTRYVFSNWSDGGGQSHSITVSSSAATYTANFATQYLLTSSVSPAAGGTVAANPSSTDGYYASGTAVQLSAGTSAGYQFVNWSGDLTGVTNPQSVTMNVPRNVTANFSSAAVVTIATNPSGLAIVVDGASLTAAQSFTWTPGTSHSIGVASPQGSGATRYVFNNWSDGGGRSHSITVPSFAVTYTANFTTQYLLTSGVSPVSGGVVTANPSSPDGYYSTGTSVQLTAAANAGYQFSNWSGDLTGTANPQSVTMNAPRNVAANFGSAALITIATNPPGLAIVVDGATLTAPQSFPWAVGTSHNLSVTSPQGSGGTRYAFNSWSDGGGQTHGILTPAAGATYTANFASQYLLTSSVSPAAGGTVAASPSSPDGYYSAGSSVQLTATANSGYQFANWSGDLTGSANPQSVIMSAPRNATANFSSISGVTIATNPPGLAIVVDGVSLAAPQSFNWVAGTSHGIGVVSPQSSGGTRSMFNNWSDGGGQTHSITVPSSAATYTASFAAQYLLTSSASPALGGSLTANPSTPDGYYAAGTAVQLTAAANAGYQFANWSGDLIGAANPQSVVMNAPLSVTASFNSLTGITIATNPPGLAIVVDGASLTAPQSFTWTAGTSHSLSVASGQGSAGTRYVFNNWTDGGGQTHSILVPFSAATYTANFATQYLLTSGVSPAAGGTVTANPSSSDGYYAAGAAVQLTAAANAGYQFANWSGDLTGSANPQSVTMSATRSVTANFNSVALITIAANPAGLAIVVDGASLTAPQSFTWTAGASHSIGVTSPQGSGGTRYVFGNWSDGGGQTHSIVVPASAATYTVTFAAQYLLATSALPSGGGSVAANPASADGFYASGSAVQLTASPSATYRFASWTGDLAGTANPQSLAMNAPHSVVANFASAMTSVTVLTNPSGQTITADGVSYASPQPFSWAAGSVHSLSVNSPQGSGGVRYAFASWSDGGAQTHNVTVPSNGATYVANFTTQYLVATTVAPSAGGTVTLSPSAADGFYTSGTLLQLTAVPNTSAWYYFANWSGDVVGTPNPQTVFVNAPFNVKANFTLSKVADNSFFVNQLYLDLLGRPADSTGLNFWLPQLTSGQTTRGQLAYSFFTSAEFESDGLFIISAYIAVLGRNPDYTGWWYNLNNLWAGTPQQQVINSFIQSTEFQTTYGSLSNTAFVQLVYQNVLGRPADAAGLSYYTSLLNSGAATEAQIIYMFVISPEFQSRIQNQALSTLLYLGFLRRTPDNAGALYWTNQLNAGLPPSTVLNAFITSPEYLARF